MDNKIELNSVLDSSMVLSFLGICLFTGLFAGSVPSFVLSSFRTVHVLSGESHTGTRRGRFSTGVRKILVTLQFTMSIALIVCTLIAGRQYHFLQTSDLGMNREQMLVIRNISHKVRTQYPILKKEFMDHPGIRNVSASMDVPSRDILDAGFCRVEGLPEDQDAPALAMQSVAPNFFDFMKIQMAAGYGFKPVQPESLPLFNDQENRLAAMQSYVLEKKRTYLINESALKVFGWRSASEAIGKRIDWRNAAFQTIYGEITGVVKDYHYASLSLKIRPLVLMNEPLFFSCILVKMDSENMTPAISHMKSTWNRLFPDLPFHVEFVDDLFDSLYRTEEKQDRLLSAFSVLAVLIAYLGLFGLASFTAEQRTHEIGIRKVLGASVPGILILLMKEFAKWILLAAVIASALSWWIMNRWLENYAYRINISWQPFAIASGLALLIAMLTVSFQTVRAATANPVDSLRYE